MNNISSLLSDIVQAPNSTDNVLFGVVTNVDETEKTCSVRPYNSSAEVTRVRLIAQSDSTEGDVRQGVILMPRKGSSVMIVMESDTEAFVGLYSQVDAVQCIIKASKDESGSIVYDAAGSKQEVKSEKGTTIVDISATGFSQKTDDTTLDITKDGYAQKTGNTTVDITTDGYSQKTGLTEIEFKEKLLIKNQAGSLGVVIDQLLFGLENLIVPTGVGPSGVPTNATFFTALRNQLKEIFKDVQ